MSGSLVSEYARVHRSKRYGDTGWRALPFILPHLLALRPASLVDFGCGQSDLGFRLGRALGIGLLGRYDPAIPELARRPAGRFDVLVNVDVLEHIPDEELDAALVDMAALADQAIWVIDTAPANLKLSDGRNAHVSLHDEDWWLARLQRHFPGARPIAIGRRNRVGFKTWDAELSPADHAGLVRRGVFRRDLERFLKAFGLATGS